MPNQYSTLAGLFTGIANAIREKDGSSAPIVADAFPSAIRNIPGGGDHSAEDNLIMRNLSGAYENSRVTLIGKSMFQGLDITSVTFPACIAIHSNAFSYCSILTYASFPACETVGSEAFYSCSHLNTIYFPNCSVINNNAFHRCSSLSTISLPKCRTIGAFGFAGCNLQIIQLPSCEVISSSAFNMCALLSDVTLQKQVTIGSWAFSGCFRQLALRLYASSLCTLLASNAFTYNPIGGNTLQTSGVYGSIYVPASLLDAYKSAANWSYFADRFVGVNPEDM